MEATVSDKAPTCSFVHCGQEAEYSHPVKCSASSKFFQFTASVCEAHEKMLHQGTPMALFFYSDKPAATV